VLAVARKGGNGSVSNSLVVASAGLLDIGGLGARNGANKILDDEIVSEAALAVLVKGQSSKISSNRASALGCSLSNACREASRWVRTLAGDASFILSARARI
jgi:hypothetical protein